MKWLITILGTLLWQVKRVRYALRLAAYRRLGATIGRRVRLYGHIDGVNPHQVTIGDNTVLGLGARVIAHGPIRGPQPVRIGRNCFIGYGALILPGVTVGDDCIIGAGAVVTRDVPPGSVAAGNPARVLRPRDPDELRRTVALIEQGKPVGAAPEEEAAP